MYEPKHFADSLDSLAKQLLPQAIYKRRGVKGLELMDNRILEFIENLRENLGLPITVNNWHVGGVYSQSGFRDVEHYGSYEAMDRSLSQHKYGRGLDLRVEGMTAHEVRKHIIDNQHIYPYISFLEVGISWVHVDCRSRLKGASIVYWSPTDGYLSELEVMTREL